MTINLIDKEGGCRLVFDGCLTSEYARELEDRLIDALRRYTRFEVDLSGVQEVDHCGLHLLRILNTVAGDHVEMVAPSPIVELAALQNLGAGRQYARAA